MGVQFQFCTLRILQVDGGDRCTQYHQTIQLKMAKLVNFMRCVFYHKNMKPF